MKKFFILIIICLTSFVSLFSQNDEVVRRLKEKGIDVNRIDPTNPADLQRIEAALSEVIQEMAQEQAGNVGQMVDTTLVGLEKVQQVDETKLYMPEEEKEEIEVEEILARRKEKEKIARALLQQDILSDEQIATVSELSLEEVVVIRYQKEEEFATWGQQLFRNKNLRLFNQAKDIKAPATYRLGAGDELTVAIWGYSQETFTFEIGKDGYIKPEGIPRIYVKGLPMQDVRELLQKRFSQYYRFRSNEFNVSLNEARSITVNIVGEVENMGSFTIPATNTAFNALVAAGGPTDIGSVRDIQLKRPGQETRHIDVYQYLSNPAAGQELYLEENDYIYVPVAQRLVGIAGAVNRPAQFELLQGEDLIELIDFAGRLKPNALKRNIQITRLINDEQVIEDINLMELLQKGQNYKLLHGDLVSVKVIARPYQEYVSVEGEVEVAGRFAFIPGMKVTDLVGKARLTWESRTDLAYLQRMNPDSTFFYERIHIESLLDDPSMNTNIQLNPRDHLIIFSEQNYVDSAYFNVEGAVRLPNSFPFDQSQRLKVEDAIQLAGGLRPDATDFAYILRRETTDSKSKEYIRVNLKEAIENPESNANYQLTPFDSLVVYSKFIYEDDFKVSVSGSVRNPGDFPFHPSLTLKDVITLAGGLTIDASPSRIDLFRLDIEQDDPTQTLISTLGIDADLNIISGDEQLGFLQPFDQLVVRSVPDFDLPSMIMLEGEVIYPGRYALLNDNERISNVIRRAGGVTPEAFPAGATLYRAQDTLGFVVVELDKVLENTSSKFNLILRDGDIINLPKQKNLVTIFTQGTRAEELYKDEVEETGKVNVAYLGRDANYYVQNYAGGYAKEGRRRWVTVKHANGEIQRTKNLLLFKIYPKIREGSMITVGRKIKTERELEREKVDWGQTLSNVVAGTTSIMTLVLLMQQINK